MEHRPRSAPGLEMEDLQNRPRPRAENAALSGAKEVPQHLQRPPADAAGGGEGGGGGHPQQAAHQGRLVLHRLDACRLLAKAKEIGAKLSLSQPDL